MKNDKNKGLQKSEKKETSIVRSSAAEYLTFVAAGAARKSAWKCHNPKTRQTVVSGYAA